ncbi:salivary peroxidase/catechol oxidase [Lepeophtheirus salmonis]|uniref:salivary peroxidase/catechol oxidase n=1 Tax=Lepeophtheirus salmonis TaxID=72036 RepID=UPI001AEB6839|nr:chorion peroxidase-like [Lepeophtheirus salmonis]
MKYHSEYREFSPSLLSFLIIVTSLLHTSSGQEGSLGNCFIKSRPIDEPRRCDENARYRTISGRCNNIHNSEWGSTGSTFNRLIPDAYQDRRSIPRGGRHPSALPNPRWISQRNHPDNDKPDHRFTHMVMQFGQFLDHDLSLAPKDESTDCCESEVQRDDCFTIPIPSPDRFYSWVNSSAQCLNLLRSHHVCGTIIREQYNILTSYVDASHIYGSDQTMAAVLRTYKDGRLHVNPDNDQLPTKVQLNLRPNTRLLRPEKESDFVAGDNRVNEHPFLSSMHVIFLREHNKIARGLKKYLPVELRTDEIIYQETRRLVAAEFQNIVYGEFLPTVLGVDYMKKYNLIVTEESTYRVNVNAGMINSFVTAAYRFGHSMINGMFKLVSQRGISTVAKTKNSKNDIFWLWRLREVFDGQSIRGATLPIENMIDGLITQKPQTCDAFFTTEVTDHLFQKNSRRQNFGEDLLAINIQRGRDHGIPSYNNYRKLCGLEVLTSWSRRPKELASDYWSQLESVYNNVDDIDLYVGGIAELNVRGGVVGPTFACIIGEQFSRLKDGDRFFYTHKSNSALRVRGLETVAKKEILKRSLGDIICGCTSLKIIQKWVTLQPNEDYNPTQFCNNKVGLNFEVIAQEIAKSLSKNNGESERVVGGRSLPTFGFTSSPTKTVRFTPNDAININNPIKSSSSSSSGVGFQSLSSSSSFTPLIFKSSRKI